MALGISLQSSYKYVQSFVHSPSFPEGDATCNRRARPFRTNLAPSGTNLFPSPSSPKGTCCAYAHPFGERLHSPSVPRAPPKVLHVRAREGDATRTGRAQQYALSVVVIRVQTCVSTLVQTTPMSIGFRCHNFLLVCQNQGSKGL